MSIVSQHRIDNIRAAVSLAVRIARVDIETAAKALALNSADEMPFVREALYQSANNPTDSAYAYALLNRLDAS